MTRLKRFFIALIAAVSLAVPAGAAEEATTYFPYPVIPESTPLGRQRANYFVVHFWDHCPWKSAFSSKRKMNEAFKDYVETFPHAAADTVYMSIDNMIDKVKKNPADLLSLARMAEATFYADTAAFPNELVYLPFAKATLNQKKIPAADREHFRRQVSVIEHSQVGASLPDLQLRLADGSTLSLADTTAGANEYVIFFDTPDSFIGRMDRTTLAANASAKTLIDSNLLKPMFIYPGTPDAAWWESASSLPSTWIVAALPEAEEYFDLRAKPSVYVTDSSKRITERFLPVQTLIRACEHIMDQYRRN